MKNILITIFISFLLNFSAKANPWLVLEGIGIGVQVLEAGVKKISDVNKSRKTKKRINNEAKRLKEGSKIITFLECNNLQPNYSPDTIFKIDLENKYIKIDQGGKIELIYFKVNKILNSKIISTEAFSPDIKKQKKINEYNKYIDVTYTFDAEAKTIKILTLLEPNAPKKWKKNIAKNIKKGKLANKTNANCKVLGERYLIKKETTKKNNLAKWVAVVEHKEKKIFYSSDNKKEMNTREKAVNNAISKCWFDPNHKPGDWPSENCKVVSTKKINNLNNEDSNNYFWIAEFKHPRSDKAFISTKNSKRGLAVKDAMKKCYKFVTRVLQKVGYNDCFLARSYSVGKNYLDDKAKKEKSERAKKEKYERVKKARQVAEKEGNEQWISDNKQNYLDQFNKKLNEYEEIIRKIENRRVKLQTKVINLKTLVSNNNIKVGNTINGLKNTDDRKIIELKKSIIKNKKIYLSSSKLNNYKLRLEYIEKIKFDDYQNYKFIKRLIVNANKSNKATDFVGKDGFTIKLPKILGGKEKKLTSNKIGFIKEFSNIRNRNLGLTFNSDKKILDKLNNDIENQTANIIKYVVDPINTITLLDEELSNRVDYFKFIRLNPYYWVFNSVYSLR